MNEERSTLQTIIIWQQYQFTFKGIKSIDSAFSNLVREKLDSLGLSNEDADIRYEEAEGETELYNIYVRQTVAEDPVRTPLQSRDNLIFERAQQSSPAESIMVPQADQPQVESVSFKGAIRNPPQSADPLP